MNGGTMHDRPHRVETEFFTFGTMTLFIIMGIGFSFGVTRLLLGLGSVTNLSDQNPWGIWISFDVACGVALAAGGFTTAALVDIFGRERYKSLLRPAILTAFLGYLWVAIALCFDLGRYWNIWRPVFNWQGNSVLFEVGMCVAFYLLVLSIEMSPSIFEGLEERIDKGGSGAALLRPAKKLVKTLHDVVRIVLPFFIVAGVVLSCMHQSSLGTLMLIAPSKLSSLWNTPILPVLFLMSAIMVGFPMVILESIYASKSFGRDPEMELLTPLSSKIPWFIGAYGLVKIGDLVVRHNQLDLLAHPAATTSLVVEVLLGVAAPFFLLMNKAVRRSMGWLFFSTALIILGVVLNRINVFLVGYYPPYNTEAYFPSVGEIALTFAIVSSIMFFYRLFVTYFPILPGYVSATEVHMPRLEAERPSTVGPFWTWVTRGAGIAALLGFVAFYSLVHTSALQSSVRTVEEFRRVQAGQPSGTGPAASIHPQRPSGYKDFYVLNSSALNARSDDYEPMGFAHRIHDELVNGDCGACHHRYSMSDGDRVGEDIKSLHASMDVKLGGPCASCHGDMQKNPPQSCSRCHGLSNEPDAPSRIGLKGAYHQQCIGCHANRLKAESAPTECSSCHHPWTPDHAKLVSFKEKPGPQDVTRTCLGCHAKEGRDILGTAHWNWKGFTPSLSGYEHRKDLSLSLMVNNYCISMESNPRQCASCHIGYGAVDKGFDFADTSGIDCLVCHDTTGDYRKDPAKGGLPDPSIDLAAIARKVGRPSRTTCGSCHFSAAKSSSGASHKGLDAALAKPPPGLDFHMGDLNMRCQDCHTTSRHKIAGMSSSAPAVEGRVTCEKCHGNSPHGVVGLLNRHLDDHVKAVACETCHIPLYARGSPEVVRRDYSTAGRDASEIPGDPVTHRYDKRFGTLVLGMNMVPAYLWYDGTRKVSVAGGKIDPSSTVLLNPPVGEKRDPAARIFPFEVHEAVQPYDSENMTLALPSLLDGYWSHFDWSRAIEEGMKRAGLAYSGKYGFVETRMYQALHHEVVPARKALGCTDCHNQKAVDCARCHSDANGTELPRQSSANYPDVRNRMDFKVLGYPGDPAFLGGRFYATFRRGQPPK